MSSREARKETLYKLAQYERGWLETALDGLREEMKDGLEKLPMAIWTLSCDLTDLYG